jgi:ABC-type polysaccharide/polyol phosphate transport system ATPase subunit
VSDAIVIERLGKKYRKLDDHPSLVASLLPIVRARRSELWALRDVSLRVADGETVGVIGRNGSGKTTLLRALCGVTRPTEGRVRITGRVAPLIGIGVGFRKEMSGRANIELNGMLLGMTRRQVAERFDDIVAFSEIADFIDTPVKFYSSGMFLRLGFAIAIHSDPDVFLLDEILAVGDVAFQGKCIRRMRDIRDSGTTIVVVSHSMQAIRHLCDRVVLLHRGLVQYEGAPEEVIARYFELMATEEDTSQRAPDSGVPEVVGGASIVDARVVGADFAEFLEPGSTAAMHMRVRFEREVADPVFGMQIFKDDGTFVYASHSRLDHTYRTYAAGDVAEVVIRFTVSLGNGTFRVSPYAAGADGRSVLAYHSRGMTFYVPGRPASQGIADLVASVEADGVALDQPAGDFNLRKAAR